MHDGVLETFTGAMFDPYLDADGRPTDNRGIAFIDPERLPGWVTSLDAAGLQPHFHAIGDRAVRDRLDAVEAARAANGRTDTRPHVAHIQVIHPDDVPRFASLDVAANAQPLWACHEGQMDKLTIPFLGPGADDVAVPVQVACSGPARRLAMGSDWSVSTPNPFEEMEVAVTRVYRRIARPAEPFLPDERLDARGGRPRLHRLARRTSTTSTTTTGSIEVGKLADLIVVDRDLFAPDAGPIGEARVLLTVVGGDAVFEDSGARLTNDVGGLPTARRWAAHGGRSMISS